MSVWIDTDMGFDDIAALLVVAHSGPPIAGVSLVFGNTPLEQVQKNAAGAALAFGWNFPIYAGRAAPATAPLETAQSILGETGIPTRGLMLPEVPVPHYGDAFSALCRWLEADDCSGRILALGPLTNIAALALARPDLSAKISDLTWMGGGITTGNHTASAEFNALADPEALAIVLSHKLPLRMVDLDFCRKILLLPGDPETIGAKGGKNARLLADFAGGFLDIGLKRRRKAMAFYDPAAAVAFLRDDIVTFAPARIDVETGGHHTRGRTVVEFRPEKAAPNASCAVDCDAEAVRSMILTTLFSEASR